MIKRILVIHPRLCIRAIKQIKGLLSQTDYKIIIVSSPNYINRFPELIDNERLEFIIFDFHSNFISRYKFRKFLRKLKQDFDIVHCHNEPNYHVVDAIKVFSGRIPVVYDIHDMTSMRSNEPQKDEKYAYLNSDAIIHVSNEFVKNGDRKYGKQNCHVVLSSPSIESFQQDAAKTEPNFNELHFVYQGGLYDPAWEYGEKFKYRNYLPYFKEILGEGHHVHLYPPLTSDKLPSYKKLSDNSDRFHFHETLEYSELMKIISKYDFGIAGFNFDELENKSIIQFLNTAVGNKLLDYTFARIPVVVINAKAMENFATKYGFGVVKTEGRTWTETVTNWQPTCNFEAFANEYCMEKQILKLINMIEKLSNTEIKRSKK